MALQAAKEAVRSEVRRRIKAMSAAQKLIQSEIVKTKLIQLPQYKSCKRIAVYVSIDDEVRTNKIIEHIFKDGKSCFIPRFQLGSSHMEMLKAPSLEAVKTLPEAAWQVLQPDEKCGWENALDTGGLEMVIVPGRAFTIDGKRLGRGGGYYDGYLRRCPGAVTLGLAFKEQIFPDVPFGVQDVLLHGVLFPDENSQV